MRRRRGAAGSPQLQSFLNSLLGRKNGKLVAILIAVLVGGYGVMSSREPERVQTDAPTMSRSAAQTRQDAATVAKGDQITARVVKVSDGDTITLLTPAKQQVKIRMLGIDAPEKSQPYGNACREKLAELVAGKTVQVDIAGTDRYGRSIGKVIVEGKDVNLAQIEVGCAWHYKSYSRNQTPEDRELYSRKEIEAHERKQGLWQMPNPEPPWVYRKAKREHRQPSEQP